MRSPLKNQAAPAGLSDDRRPVRPTDMTGSKSAAAAKRKENPAVNGSKDADGEDEDLVSAL